MARGPGGGSGAGFLSLQDLLEKHADEVARILTTENGKTLDDARGSVRRAIQMVEVACGMPSLMQGYSLENVSKGIDCQTIRQPLGVCAGITPFNFPAMVPMWMFPFAIACGNTFILKPSEKVPMTPTRTAELAARGRLPAGVFNLLHGDKVSVDALLRHPLVRAISFVGSSPVAKYVYQTSAAEGKRVQALGGAKNHLVVMPDANLEKSVEAIMSSAFGAAGERCLAGSVLVAVGSVAEPLLDLLSRKTRALKVGDGAEPATDMGPLVTAEHRKKVVSYIDKGEAEGATLVCDGRADSDSGCGRLFRRADDFRPRQAGFDHRAGGDFRAGALRNPRRGSGRGDRPGKQLGIRKHNQHLYRRWQIRARICPSGGSRDGRGQHGGGGADGVLPIFRLEEFVLRRPARARARRDSFLHRAESPDDALVLRRGQRCAGESAS